jgi:hypothetical protein
MFLNQIICTKNSLYQIIITLKKLSEFIYILNLCIIDFLIIFKILKIEINEVEEIVLVQISRFSSLLRPISNSNF